MDVAAIALFILATNVVEEPLQHLTLEIQYEVMGKRLEQKYEMTETQQMMMDDQAHAQLKMDINAQEGLPQMLILETLFEVMGKELVQKHEMTEIQQITMDAQVLA